MKRRVVILLTATLFFPPALLPLLFGCVEPQELRGTFQETQPIPADRDRAYRLSLFRFGEEVGGVIRFFEIGEYLNTRDNPYFLESSCSYFGPIRLSHDSFRFSMEDQADGKQHVFQFTALDTSTIQGQVNVLPLNSLQEEAQQIQFDLERVGLPLDRSCTTTAFDLEIELPSHTTEQYAQLALAIVYVGYDDQGNVTRTNPNTAFVVGLDRDELHWSTKERLTPPLPTSQGMSAPNYPTEGAVQYSLGYVVLFEDQASPGEYWHNVVGDQVVALSLDQVLLYIEEPAEYLDPSVAAIFSDLAEVSLGFGVYFVQHERHGNLAVVTTASRKATNRILLQEVAPQDRALFPVLLPEGLIP
ncbi:MAG: hypothetical protein JW797_19350 [Bradymonadales bacterium]|nr:hypothetical protein [Bradymonadales bacterium]